MDREATDKELSGGVICDGLGSSIAALFGVLPNTSFSQERRSGYDDKGSQPHGTCNRRGIPDSVRSDSEAGCDRFDHARSRYWEAQRL